MKEIEVKILNINKKNIINKLKELGANKILDDEVYSEFYDTPDNVLKKQGRILRLRKTGQQCFLTIKKLLKHKQAKYADETEVEVCSFSNTKKILPALGFKMFDKSKKHRESYRFGNARFEIDTLKGIPAYLEIEAKSIKELKRAVFLLGYKMSDTLCWSGKDVIEHYGKLKNKII